jgi:hypothetical protein
MRTSGHTLPALLADAIHLSYGAERVLKRATAVFWRALALRLERQRNDKCEDIPW